MRRVGTRVAAGLGRRALAIAAVALLTAACGGGTPRDADQETSPCAGVYRVGERVADGQYGPCLNADGKSVAARTHTLKCRDGERLISNEYGWWSSNEFVVHALVRGAPPESVVHACATAPPSSDVPTG